MGVPTKLGKNGIEQILELPLSDQERSELSMSPSKTWKQNVEKLKTMVPA